MTLPEKIAAVEQLFAELDQAITRFQQISGLKCPAGCGQCCFKPDIEATVLEFLPFAWHVYENGEAEKWYEKLNLETSPVCAVLNPLQQGKGLCTMYRYRGLICRLFGYSARLNKYGQAELITCNIIHGQPLYQPAAKAIAEGRMEVPVMRDYYMQLQVIDPVLGVERISINRAILRALETVMHYKAYYESEQGVTDSTPE